MIALSKVESRQIPKIKKIISDKKYHDILYSYLQSQSKWDGEIGHPRYINKKLINFSKMGQALGISRQTASRRFQNLITLGLISEEPNDKGDYILQLLPSDVAALIPERTLELLVNTLNDNSISTYIYLMMRYIANDERSFRFSVEEIKNFIGISVTTRSNNNVVNDILNVLQKIGLIKFRIISAGNENEIKLIHELEFLTNYID